MYLVVLIMYRSRYCGHVVVASGVILHLLLRGNAPGCLQERLFLRRVHVGGGAVVVHLVLDILVLLHHGVAQSVEILVAQLLVVLVTLLAVLAPLVVGAAARVHEKVADGRGFEP